MIRPLAFSASLWLVCCSCSILFGDDPIEFHRDIAPLLQKNCVACHNLKLPEGGLSLESYEDTLKGGDAGKLFDAQGSMDGLLVGRLTGEEDSLMPPEDNSVGAKPFTPAEIDLVRRWIKQGAVAGTPVAMAPTALQWSPVPASLRPIYALANTWDGQWMGVSRANQTTVYRWPAWQGASEKFELVDPTVQAINHSTQSATHVDLVQSMAFSPDGNWLVTAAFREAKIWSKQRRSIPIDAFSFASNAVHVAASPQGDWLAIETVEHIIEIWDAFGKAKRVSLQGHAAPLTALSWSSDGEKLASCDAQGQVVLWQIAPTSSGSIKMEQAMARESLPTPLRQIVWLGSDSLAGRNQEGRLLLWNVQPAAPDTQSTGTLIKLPLFDDRQSVVALAAVVGTPHRLLMGHQDGSLHLAQVTDGQVLWSAQHGAPLQVACLSPDQSRLASVGANGQTRVWNVADGKMLFEIQGDHGSRRDLQLAQQALARQNALLERLTATSTELEKNKQAETEAKAKIQVERDKAAEMVAAKVAELATTMQAFTLAETNANAARMAMEEATRKFEEANKALSLAAENKKKSEGVRAEAESQLMKFDQTLAAANDAIDRATKALPVHLEGVEKERTHLTQIQQKLDSTTAQSATLPTALAATFSPDSKQFATVHEDQKLRIYRMEKGLAAETVSLDGPASSLAWTNNQRLLLAHAQAPLQWRDLGMQWHHVRTIGGLESSPISDRITAMDISPDNQWLALGSGPPSRFGDIKVFSLSDGTLIKDLGPLHSDSVLALRFSPTGNELASAGADKIVRITKMNESKPYRTLEGHTHHVLGLAWHDQGHWLASGSADSTVKLWDVQSGQQVRTVTGFGKEVTSLAFVGATKQVASACADRTVRIHDMENGNQIRALGGPVDALFAISISDEGKSVVAGGQDGKVWIWQLDNGQVLQQID